jgi:hypothetical protein
MLKNESARNATKPVPLRPSRLPDSGGIFTSSNGVRMEKISRSVRKVKQAKKGDDCTVRTVHVAGSVQLTWQGRTADVAASEGDMWQTVRRTRGITRTRHVSYGFGISGVQLDQYGGDTCHHSQGDTWQDDVIG